LAKGTGIDRWEEGFDGWTPRSGGGGVSDDTGIDSDKAALLRLARELAEQRHADHEQARVELEQLKQALRERAEAVAARERELMELQRRLDNGKPAKPAKQGRKDVAAGDVLVARERAALERAQALELRERELQARQAELDADAARFTEREQELEAALAGALAQSGRSESERELAAAERVKLDEREQEARRIEKALAARRIELEAEQSALEARARAIEAQAAVLRATAPELELELEPVPVVQAGLDATAQREDELRVLEAKLETRERELALMRQGLDAERNALLDRERSLRRREVADVRQTFDAPLAPPSFSEGLAAFARGRSRE
jgi:chromosome segregation ATPase